MEEFLTYVENTTDAYAKLASSSLVKEIHKKVIQIKHNKEMEVEYMTLMQRDREKREEGIQLAGKICKLYSKGLSKEEIEMELDIDLDSIDLAIDSFEE